MIISFIRWKAYPDLNEKDILDNQKFCKNDQSTLTLGEIFDQQQKIF